MSAATSPPRLASLSDRDTCAACAAPLAPTARYCLNCGTPQEGARSELVDLVTEPAAATAATAPSLTAAAPPPPAPTTTGPPPPVAGGRVAVGPPLLSPPARPSWPFALTAVVLSALVIGLLAGGFLAARHDGPQVIHVGAATPTPAATTTAAPTATAVTP